jgi:hypothetical protein
LWIRPGSLMCLLLAVVLLEDRGQVAVVVLVVIL